MKAHLVIKSIIEIEGKSAKKVISSHMSHVFQIIKNTLTNIGKCQNLSKIVLKCWKQLNTRRKWTDARKSLDAWHRAKMVVI